MKNKEATLSYILGFALSLVLTLLAFFIVINHVLSGALLTASVVSLALIQLFVQLTFFLHVWQEDRPRWNLIIFLATVSVIIIVVFGSLWIMNNLNYHIMSPESTDKYLIHDEGIHR